MTYKISIIIPLFNAEPFINVALESIMKQTMNFEDIEVILVNDCSEDNTEEIINKYARKHKNIKPINLRNNCGCPATPRNIGITYATADYLMFLDQDDTFKSNACETLYNKITKEQVDLVCGNLNMIVNGRANIAFPLDWMKEEELKIDCIDENPNFLNIGVAVWSKIFKKDLIMNNNLKFTEGIGEDIFFSIRALLLAKGIVLLKNFIVVDYQIREESLSHQVDSPYMHEFADFYLDFFDYCNKNIKDEYYLPLFNGRMNNILGSLFYSDLYYDELASVFKKIHKLFLQLSEKPFKFYNREYQLFFDTLINDEYPFKLSIMAYSMIKANKENKFDKFTKYFTQESKLYIDSGKGFNEIETIKQYYKISEQNEILFDLSQFNNIKQIRFDPINWYFIKCEIKEVSSNNGKLSFKPINSIDNNAKSHEFLTTDSQYLFEGNFSNIKYINIKLSIKLINNAKIAQILNR